MPFLKVRAGPEVGLPEEGPPCSPHALLALPCSPTKPPASITAASSPSLSHHSLCWLSQFRVHFRNLTGLAQALGGSLWGLGGWAATNRFLVQVPSSGHLARVEGEEKP